MPRRTDWQRGRIGGGGPRPPADSVVPTPADGAKREAAPVGDAASALDVGPADTSRDQQLSDLAVDLLSLPDATVDGPPPSPAELLVREAFCRVLSRPAGPPGLAAYQAKVAAGALSAKQLVEEPVKSAEYETSFVASKTNEVVIEGLFDALLARNAEPAALTFYTAVLISGSAHTVIADDILGSPEYHNNFGTDKVPGDGRPGCY